MTSPDISTGPATAGGDDAPTRRDVIRYGAALGAVTAGAGAASLLRGSAAASTPTRIVPIDGVLDLYVNEGYVPMVDGAMVYMRGFGDRPTTINDPSPSLTATPHIFFADGRLVADRLFPPTAAPPPKGRPSPAHPVVGDPLVYALKRRHWGSYFPARTIIAETGSRIRLRVHNTLTQPHELSLLGLATTGTIAPGQTATVELSAPAAGTYVFADPGGGPVQRTLGLFGVLVVVPADDHWRLTSGGAEFERQWLWICHDIDPVWSRRAQLGEVIDPVATPAVPAYFTLNGRAGFESVAVTEDEEINLASHEETLVAGSPRRTDVRDFSASATATTVVTGQMIRMVNAGVAVHQMHFHGNHVWTLRNNAVDYSRTTGSIDAEGHVLMQHWEDTVELDPLDRKVVVLALKPPPDALPEVFAARTEDWHYPMHCHAETSQTAHGGLYPGGIMADWVMAPPTPTGPAPRTAEHHTYPTQVAFAIDQPKEGSPTTEFRKTPDRTFLRKFFNRRLRFPDGSEHEIWGFEDATSGRGLPSPLIRATEGEMIHVPLKASKRVHTIHIHGQEPDPRNDGVGHTSFEVTGEYTYQWSPERGVPGDPNKGSSGTYFYHCHVNTVLHVQMGMFGALIIDPVVHPSYPVTPGRTRRSFVDGPEYDIATETLLVPYTVDPRWHQLGHAAGLSGEDVGLNRFDPQFFYILGGNLSRPAPTAGGVQVLRDIRANVVGNGTAPSLLRVNNASYFPCRLRITEADGVTPALIGELIAHDGRPLRDTSNPTGPSRAMRDLGRPVMTDRVAFGSAERYDLLLLPPRAGEYRAHIDYTHWISGRNLATRTLTIYAS